MKKYVDSRGEVIKEGNLVMVSMKDKNGNSIGEMITVVDSKLIEKGLRDGIIMEIEEPEGGTILDIDYYIKHLAERIGWKYGNILKYLDNLAKINPTSVFQILLREVAIVLDEKYPDHIEKSKEIWVISNVNGKITKASDEARKNIPNFRNFAAFRTLDDAKAARHILKIPMKNLFSKPKSKSGRK